MNTGGDNPALWREVVASLLPLIKKPDAHVNPVPMVRRQRYRGRWQIVIGYTWGCKPRRTYDRVLASGYDFDNAVKKLCERYKLDRPTHAKHFPFHGPTDASPVNGTPMIHPHHGVPEWVCKECDATNPGTWGRCRCGAFKH